MIEINITTQQIERAKEWYDFYNINNSFTKGNSQIYGALGEIIFLDYYELKSTSYVGTKDYDFLYKAKKIEIKTKKTSTPPLPNYLCSIPMTSAHQRCDEYVFIRILNNMSKAWICGWMEKNAFFTKGFYGAEGEIDHTSGNNFKFKEDCMNIQISSLKTHYNGNLNEEFIKNFFKVKQSLPFIMTEYKSHVEINGGELLLRLIYEKETKKLTVQELNKGTLFNGYVNSQKQFKYLFEHLLQINI